MPVYRGSDGKIIEEKTRTVSADSGKKTAGDIDGKTRKLSSKPVPPTSSGEQADISPNTTLFKSSSNSEIMPVVGWLVVVDGAGLGSSFALGAGANSIGRGADQAVALSFGDKQISRQNHSILTYDPKSNEFYIQGGGGRSLTYLSGEVVLEPTKLRHKDNIQLGETTLNFVAFCSDEFNWAEK